MTDTADSAAPTEDTAELPGFPMPRRCPFDLNEQYAELREEAPITPVALASSRDAWLVTSHEHVRTLFLDPRLSADGTHPTFPILAPRRKSFDEQAKGFLPWMDPPEHTRYRRMLINEFTVRRIRAMRPRVQAVVDACIDRMLAGPRPADLVQALALPVPSQTICDVLGVPYEDLDHIQDRAQVMVSKVHPPEERAAALRDLRTYLGELLHRKAAEPADDTLSRLVARHRAAGADDHDHLTGLALLILIGGYESTASTIALGTVALLAHPEQADALRADPSLAPKAVEELLRFFSVADNVTSRVSLEDVEIGGVTIRKGQGVLLSNAAANRDAAVFPEPETLDVHRDARQHMAFGYGIHQCLGQNLARLELDVVFSTLLERVPGLRLAVPVDDLPFKDDAIMYGIHELPVTW
ncbi:cytochrome P450 [Streptomyces sp. NBC_01198]|uniref:cytochrome P450 n=1 Tax=Streptomyces sp. NBC_01198 TaxID=2903769 RepID=UPI003FA38CE0